MPLQFNNSDEFVPIEEEINTMLKCQVEKHLDQIKSKPFKAGGKPMLTILHNIISAIVREKSHRLNNLQLY